MSDLSGPGFTGSPRASTSARVIPTFTGPIDAPGTKSTIGPTALDALALLVAAAVALAAGRSGPDAPVAQPVPIINASHAHRPAFISSSAVGRPLDAPVREKILSHMDDAGRAPP